MGILEDKNGDTPLNGTPKLEGKASNGIHANGVTDDNHDQSSHLNVTLSLAAVHTNGGSPNRQPGDPIISAESLIRPLVASLVQNALEAEKARQAEEAKKEPEPEMPSAPTEEQSHRSLRRSRAA